MINVLKRITALRMARGWTEYGLACRCDLPQSTISSWYRHNMLPSLGSLEKICKGFDLTLSQFFLSETDPVTTLTKQQRELLENWFKLSDTQKKKLLALIDGMLQK